MRIWLCQLAHPALISALNSRIFRNPACRSRDGPKPSQQLGLTTVTPETILQSILSVWMPDDVTSALYLFLCCYSDMLLSRASCGSSVWDGEFPCADSFVTTWFNMWESHTFENSDIEKISQRGCFNWLLHGKGDTMTILHAPVDHSLMRSLMSGYELMQNRS